MPKVDEISPSFFHSEVNRMAVLSFCKVLAKTEEDFARILAPKFADRKNSEIRRKISQKLREGPTMIIFET